MKSIAFCAVLGLATIANAAPIHSDVKAYQALVLAGCPDRDHRVSSWPPQTHLSAKSWSGTPDGCCKTSDNIPILKPPAPLWHFASQLLWPVLFLVALLTERG
jgi:hypothetical protein